MKTAIKITLNSSVVFDAAVLEYLDGKKNKAGLLKQLAYDRLVSRAQGNGYREPDTATVSQISAELAGGGSEKKTAIDESLITKKLDKFADFKF